MGTLCVNIINIIQDLLEMEWDSYFERRTLYYCQLLIQNDEGDQIQPFRIYCNTII